MPDPTVPAADRSDADLLLGLHGRQPGVLLELYTRYFPWAYALAVRMLVDADRAEDCVHRVFLHLGQQPPPADPDPATVRTWVLQTVQQQARIQQRQPSAPPPPDPAAAASPAAIPPTGPGRITARHALAAAQQTSRAAVATLPLVERTVLELAYIQGQPLAAIAVVVAESPHAVLGHMRAGLDHLHTALAASTAPAPAAGIAALPAGAGPALSHLTRVLADLARAQQRAADLRDRTTTLDAHAQALQQRAAAQQQQATAAVQQATAAVQQATVLHELYAYLHLQFTERGQVCDHTLAQTAAYFAQHPQQIDVSQVAAVLALLNAPCDCAAHRRLPDVLR